MNIELDENEAMVTYEALKVAASRCDDNDEHLMDLVGVMKKIYFSEKFPREIYNEPEASVQI